MDLNFDHNFNADARGTSVPGDSDNRLMFVATDNQEVVAYDTWNFGEVASIPIRDPIIGCCVWPDCRAASSSWLV